MKRKVIMLVIGVLLVFGLAGCGTATSETKNEKVVTETVVDSIDEKEAVNGITEVPEEKVKVEDLDTTVTGTWYSVSENSLYKEATISSDVIEVVYADSAVKVQGLVKGTEFVKVTTSDNATGYMQESVLSIVKGGYTEEMTEEPAEVAETSQPALTEANNYGVDDATKQEMIESGTWESYLDVVAPFRNETTNNTGNGEVHYDSSSDTEIDWSSIDSSDSTIGEVNVN